MMSTHVSTCVDQRIPHQFEVYTLEELRKYDIYIYIYTYIHTYIDTEAELFNQIESSWWPT